MPRSKLDSVGARKLVSTTVKKWKTAYMFTIKEEEVGSGGGSGSGGAGGGAGASTAGRFRFLVIASKPTATRPIPECVVNVHVNVDATKGADDVVLTYSIENETHVYTDDDKFGEYAETLMDRTIARKKMVIGDNLQNVKTPFDLSRLPASYVTD